MMEYVSTSYIMIHANDGFNNNNNGSTRILIALSIFPEDHPH